ncbi:aa3-type cytochrome c oxidase subunit IV [Sphingomonas sp. AX6]|nr:aa3-type cytochrome c oxidase subunit IV [Sphingomonas sp. AX6]VXC57231.1 Cytochrome C oxidase subunit IV [Sphingomonas sp. AX6]
MAGNGNMKQAEGSYSGFTAMMKWGTIASFAVAAFVVWLIA